MSTADSPPSALADAPAIENGRYRITHKLGEGGMAVVYRAWDTRLQRWCAVKVLLAEYARKKKLRRRFENEAALMARLDHRHVISVYDVGTDAPLPYIIMELAEGGSTHDWIKRHGAMPARLAVDVVMQVCKGINAAHELGVIHRDIKPHNVLVSHRGVCKVTDFGIAQIEEGGGMTRTGSVMGTLGYMAPEQRADAKHVDVRADVYSIGVTLYNLLTTRTTADLFLAEHDATLLEGVPEPLVPVILKATSYRPENRYDDVNQLTRALHDARRDLPVIPDDTPSLVIEFDPGRSLSDDTFPEIAELLTDPSTLDPRTTSLSETPPPPPSPSKPLPYLMPVQDLKRADAPVPDYIDAQAETQRRPLTPIDIDVPAAQASEAAPSEEADAAKKEEEGGDLQAAEHAAELAWTLVVGVLKAAWRPLSAIALPMAFLAALLTVLIGMGAAEVHNAMVVALEARAAIYASLDQERLVIDDLVALGGSRQGLEALFHEVERTQQEPAKLDAAMRYLTLVDNQARTVSRDPTPGMAHKVQIVRERINRINLLIAAHDEAVLEWEAAANSNRGSLAVSTGFARRP